MTNNQPSVDTAQYAFSVKMSVRDYECDIEGIVNNANYLHYLEHTRHMFCLHAGFTFNEMHSRGIDPVLRHADVTYLIPLRPDDTFTSCLNISRKGVRFLFTQDIFRDSDGAQCLHAVITIVCLEDGRLGRGELLAEKFGPWMKNDE